MFRKLAAECFGTFWLVFGGCGSAVLAAGFPELGIGFAGVALAFGLTVLTMAFAVGHISGGHFNPAVTIGLWAGGRFPAKEVVGYVIAQVVGGIVAAALLYLIASGKTGFDAAASGFASNGYGEHSPGGYSMLSALVVELVLSAGFLLVIHGVGLALTLIHLISIPVTNTSVNPARSTAVAIFQGGWALEQLWFFWVVPIVGGIIGGLIYRTLLEKRD
ncbi:aquaporin Z [Escherichia coli]